MRHLKQHFFGIISFALVLLLPNQGFSQDLRLFGVYVSHFNLIEGAIFVPLPVDLDYYDSKEEKYFHLKNPEPFLTRANVEPDDTVYILDLPTNKLHQFTVEQFRLAAMEDAYQGGYHLGLALEGLDSAEIPNEYSEAIAYIGTENPFNPGQVQSMIFESIKPVEFPVALKSDSLDRFFKFSKEDYSYFMKDRGEKGPRSRRLVVIEKQTGEKVFDRSYYDSEGVSITGLVTEQNANGGYNALYTGEILKEKPAVVTGLAYYSFGCRRFEFLDSTKSPIEIWCDNRH